VAAVVVVLVLLARMLLVERQATAVQA